MEEFVGIRKQEVGRHRSPEGEAYLSEMPGPEPGGDERDQGDGKQQPRKGEDGPNRQRMTECVRFHGRLPMFLHVEEEMMALR